MTGLPGCGKTFFDDTIMRLIIPSIYGLISTSAQFFTSQDAQKQCSYNVIHIDEFDKHIVQGELGNTMKTITGRQTKTQRAVNTDYLSKDTGSNMAAAARAKRSTASTAVTRCAFLCTGKPTPSFGINLSH